ncbi:copper amine oxidase N-terminal domain-containing protein [Paenibacillus donghaensis]|uniref:Copper amine oxidase-like N-terminal domain-containing protein n=1 Tax=Paenibacillus donghaensis TaxID=414771 RepID=A0A2Z2KL37_9BACL|nr:copper amine oxidase N-terminal domain-containing protein [Paenibacillus donghaensis]ASA23159.1 hypothetical protein B9T62_21535 [Paenibacillus donghaensis]
MDFKKLTLVAVLAISQAASAVPAFAETVTSTQVPAVQNVVQPTPTPVADQPITTTEVLPSAVPGEVVPTETALPEATPLPTEPPANLLPEQLMPLPSTTPAPSALPPISAAGANQLVLMMNSNKMFFNGVPYLANQPMAVKNGVSYVSIRAMVERVGVKYTYEAKTKEVVVTSGSNVMRFKTNSKVYTVNGTKVTMKGPAYQYKGTFMIPLTSITYALKINYTVDNIQKRVILDLGIKNKPTASFTVQPTEIYAGELVSFITSSTTPSGSPIVRENWGGDKREVYDQPGTYVVTYSVVDANAQTSDPYSLTINVLKPNTPPVAEFTTDKEEYKMGELVTYTEYSSDPDGDAITSAWTSKADAFFLPGPVTIRLQVTDSHGAISSVEKTINITDETLYTEGEFNKLFAAPGSAFAIDVNETVTSWPDVAYNLSSEPYTLIRANSPETVYTQGITYRETAEGPTRFLIHHQNNLNIRAKLYLIATNNNQTPATITTEAIGMAGPSPYAAGTGKASVQRYWEALAGMGDPDRTVVVQPGESVSILTELNKIPMKLGEIISLQGDLNSDLPITYTVLMIDETKDPLATMPTLPILDSDGVHNRGTYPNSTRIMEVNDVVGLTPARLLLGDNTKDINLPGMDPMYLTEASNAGNFGVIYKIIVHRVAPNTVITFNPRGGQYMGSVLVNGSVVQVPNVGSLKTAQENSVIFRNGDYESSVEIYFTAASGSNLPVNFLFTPLPAKK